jgi:hypothetical protein
MIIKRFIIEWPHASHFAETKLLLARVGLSVANSITAVQILKTKVVIVQVFGHFSPKYAVIVPVLSN